MPDPWVSKKDLVFLLSLALSRSAGYFSPSQPRVGQLISWSGDKGSGIGYFTRSPVEQFIDVFGVGKPVHLGHPAGLKGLERVTWVWVLP